MVKTMFILRGCKYINGKPSMKPDGMFVRLEKGKPLFTDIKASAQLFETKDVALVLAREMVKDGTVIFVCEAEVKPILHKTSGGELVE